MLLIQNETTEFVKGKLSSFCKKTSEGLSKPKQKFIKDILMGLCGTGSPSIHNISKFIQDNVSTKSTSERLYRNLGQNDYVEHIDETLLQLIKPYITDETIFIVDESDIAKPYAKKMEGLQKIYESNNGIRFVIRGKGDRAVKEGLEEINFN